VSSRSWIGSMPLLLVSRRRGAAIAALTGFGRLRTNLGSQASATPPSGRDSLYRAGSDASRPRSRLSIQKLYHLEIPDGPPNRCRHDRGGPRRLVRYMARAPLAALRPFVGSSSPMEFRRRLAVLVPRPTFTLPPPDGVLVSGNDSVQPWTGALIESSRSLYSTITEPRWGWTNDQDVEAPTATKHSQMSWRSLEPCDMGADQRGASLKTAERMPKRCIPLEGGSVEEVVRSHLSCRLELRCSARRRNDRWR
jgi:hypothetical protein